MTINKAKVLLPKVPPWTKDLLYEQKMYMMALKLIVSSKVYILKNKKKKSVDSLYIINKTRTTSVVFFETNLSLVAI